MKDILSDEVVVKQVIGELHTNVINADINLDASIEYSSSQAVDEFKECTLALSEVMDRMQTMLAVDSGNLKKIHDSLKSSESK